MSKATGFIKPPVLPCIQHVKTFAKAKGMKYNEGGIANDMYNTDVGKGVVYAYEAYEAK